MSKPDLGSKLRPVVEGLLEPVEKLKLMLMRGTGPLGGLGGGETQREGVEALAGWFAENGPSQP